MRSVIVMAALMAAATLANPIKHHNLHQKRDIVYQTEYKVVYEYVYVTEGADAAAATAAAPEVVTITTTDSPATTAVIGYHGGHHSKQSSIKRSSSSTTISIAISTSAAVSTTTVAATSAVASPSASGPLSFQEVVLLHHNVHRTNHSAPALIWNSTLAQIAQEEASVCSYAHNTAGGGGGYGQNIAAGVTEADISSVITDMMYNGEMTWYSGMYGETNPSFDNFEHWGHFSQIVWKDTTSVGCAVVYCPNGLANVGSNVPPYFTVCNYYPPGNMGGGYGTNIGAPLDQISVSASYGL